MKLPLFRQTLREFVSSKTNFVCVGTIVYNAICMHNGSVDIATGTQNIIIAAGGLTIYDKLHEGKANV